MSMTGAKSYLHAVVHDTPHTSVNSYSLVTVNTYIERKQQYIHTLGWGS